MRPTRDTLTQPKSVSSGATLMELMERLHERKRRESEVRLALSRRSSPKAVGSSAGETGGHKLVAGKEIEIVWSAFIGPASRSAQCAAWCCRQTRCGATESPRATVCGRLCAVLHVRVLQAGPKQQP